MPKEKPVLGVDDLLLGLVHHWSRDRSVFPTEDDRLDLATIMLFQSYTAARPAELVDGTKSKGRKDPLLDEPEDYGALDDTLDSLEDMDIDSREDMDVDSREDMDIDFEEDEEDYVFDDDGNDTDTTADTELDDDTLDDNRLHDNAGSSHEVEEAHECLEEETDKFGDAIRKHKALCYEDITLWIVKDPKQGDRDVLAMEVYLRHHKGADRKPKPYEWHAAPIW